MPNKFPAGLAMDDKQLVLPAYYAAQIAAQVESMGVDVRNWREQCGLGPQQPDDSGWTVSLETLRRLLLEAIRLTEEPEFGLFVGARLLMNMHGILSYAAMNSGSVRQAVEVIERYIPLRTSIVKIGHEEDGRMFHVRFTESVPLDDIRRPVLEAVVLAIKNVLDYITVGACDIRYVSFPFAATDTPSLAAGFFRCEVRYQQPLAGFTLPLEIVDQPLQMADAAAFQHAIRTCQRELEQLRSQQSHASRVRQLLLERHNHFPTLEHVAQSFHLTPRTLHRRLQEEGTSFRQIIEEVRHKRAVDYLASGLGIKEVAWNLGYTDIANFRRAFKRWESLSPVAFRAKAARGP